MSQAGDSNVIFRYQRERTALLLYVSPLPLLMAAGLNLLSHNENLKRGGGMFFLCCAVASFLCFLYYLYLKSYKIAATERSLVVNSLFGSKEIPYTALKQVATKAVGRVGALYELNVTNNHGSSAIRVTGNKFLIEQMANVLKAHVTSFD